MFALHYVVVVAGGVKPPMAVLPPGEFDGASSRPQDTSGPSDITNNKPGWYDTKHLGPWNPNQPVNYIYKCLRSELFKWNIISVETRIPPIRSMRYTICF